MASKVYKKKLVPLIPAFYFKLISTQKFKKKNQKTRKNEKEKKNKACDPFSPLPDYPGGKKQILNWPNLLSQSVWNGPLPPNLSTLTVTPWLDGLDASRLQHRCSSPPVTLLGRLASGYRTLGSPFTVTVTKAENFPVCHGAFFNVSSSQRNHSIIGTKYNAAPGTVYSQPSTYFKHNSECVSWFRSGKRGQQCKPCTLQINILLLGVEQQVVLELNGTVGCAVLRGQYYS